MKCLAHEEYSLTYKHEFIDSEGTRHLLEEPVTAAFSMLTEVPQCLVINEMLERLCQYILRIAKEEGRK
jgi:hypothetical protein